VIEAFKEVVERHAAAQGWDADTREHVLLQFLANYEDATGTANDLDAFLTDLTADEGGEVPPEVTPRERCYEHLEALQELLTGHAYDLRPAAWIVVESLLQRTLAEARRPTEPIPDPDPGFSAQLSVPIADTFGFLEPADEARIKAAFVAGGVTDGIDTGSGNGYRDFAGATRTPEALLAAVVPLMPPDTQLTLRRIGGPGDLDA